MNAIYQSQRDRTPTGIAPAVDTASRTADLSDVEARLRSLQDEYDRLVQAQALSRPIIADLALNPFVSIAELRLKARIALVELVE